MESFQKSIKAIYDKPKIEIISPKKKEINKKDTIKNTRIYIVKYLNDKLKRKKFLAQREIIRKFISN